jgi:hypothetical protein
VLAVGARFSEQASSFHADIEHHFARLRDRRPGVARESNHLDLQTFQRVEQRHNLPGFSAVGNRQQGVARRKHPQIAVQGFGGMQKERRRPGA